MALRTVSASARSDASPDAVFAVLADVPRWREWMFATRSGFEVQGDPAPGGVGAIRKLGSPPVFGREEVVVFEPPRRYSYVLLTGLPVRSYRADVELAPDGAGTAIVWRGELEARPGTATVMSWFIGQMIARFASNVARRAEELSGPGR